MDLIGIPLRITVGKKVNDGKVELKKRTDNTSIDVEISQIVNKIIELVKDDLK